MGLFANPVTLNDGVASRIFSFRSQVFDKKSVVAEYIETAAAISAGSIIRVKHDPNSATPRHLIQRVTNLAPAAASTTLLPVTLNFTLTASSLFTDAELAKEFALLIDALSETNVLKNLMNNII